MSELSKAANGHDDFAAGWLVAWKGFLCAGGVVPDLSRIDLPPGMEDRLRRGAECLALLHEVWPAHPAPTAASIPPPEPEPAEGTPLPHIGRFQVRRLLGRGGFGVVYLAHDPVLNREVALKVPHASAELDPVAAHRLTVEAQAAARLCHPNIVPLHESGTAGAVPYVVSDYCPGISLADWLRRTEGPVPWEDAARVVAALARGAQHAHARGVLHRDLKPANVLLALAEGPTDCNGLAAAAVPDTAAAPLALAAYVPRIADFGMAKFLIESRGLQTATGLIQGTPGYMAPEQAAGRPRDVTTAVDVYALGAILYEILVRRPPFAADTPLATLDKVRAESPAPPRTYRPSLPLDLETVCLKCLEKDPARRYGSAAELAEDLDRLLRSEPILARRAGALEKLARAVRQHPAIVGLSALLVLSLIGGLVVAMTLLQRTRRERDRAEDHFAQLLEVSEEVAKPLVFDDRMRTEELRPLRRQMLTSSADRFARLASPLGDEAADRRLFARCQLQLASLQFALKRKDEARAAAGRAVEAYERLAQDGANDPAVLYGLTGALIRVAHLEENDFRRNRLVERAHEAYAAYAALPQHVRDQDVERDIEFAAFLYDMAVTTATKSDLDTARRYLSNSCDRLRTLVAECSAARQRALPLLAHALQFRCQLERSAARPHESIKAGQEAVTIASTVCREWPASYQHWAELAGAYNEYGLALSVGGRGAESFEVWREGYERLGEDVVRRSADGLASVIARQTYDRLMIAYNLGLGYARRWDFRSAERWFRDSLELARKLLFVMPDDRQLLYTHGICCTNLIAYRIPPGCPPDPLPLYREGLASLEKALRITPGDHELRSDLGFCWHRYADELAKTGARAQALAALVWAVVHQARATAVTPVVQDRRLRLRSHVARLGDLLAQWLTGRAELPSRIPHASD
jgi:tetratricopeptide (TPR) repeat protein